MTFNIFVIDSKAIRPEEIILQIKLIAARFDFTHCGRGWRRRSRSRSQVGAWRLAEQKVHA